MISKNLANRFILSFMLARSMKAPYFSPDEDINIATKMAEDDAMNKSELI